MGALVASRCPGAMLVPPARSFDPSDTIRGVALVRPSVAMAPVQHVHNLYTAPDLALLCVVSCACQAAWHDANLKQHAGHYSVQIRALNSGSAIRSLSRKGVQ